MDTKKDIIEKDALVEGTEVAEEEKKTLDKKVDMDVLIEKGPFHKRP